MFSGKYMKRDLLILFLILVGATVYYYFYSQGEPSIQFSEENRMVEFFGVDETSDTFSLDQIVSIELEEDPEYGEPKEGGTYNSRYLYGTWESNSLGTYHAYVSTKITPCIVLSDEEKTVAFNISNAETTQSLYEELLTYWKD